MDEQIISRCLAPGHLCLSCCPLPMLPSSHAACLSCCPLKLRLSPCSSLLLCLSLPLFCPFTATVPDPAAAEVPGSTSGTGATEPRPDAHPARAVPAASTAAGQGGWPPYKRKESHIQAHAFQTGSMQAAAQCTHCMTACPWKESVVAIFLKAARVHQHCLC